MVTSAVIKIEQFDSPSNVGDVQESVFSKTSDLSIKDLTAAVSNDLLFTSLPHISQPVASPSTPGWNTDSSSDWADSPARQPNLLYRHRFAFGRDRIELFEYGYETTHAPGEAGARWGNLDDNHGQLIYEREFPLSNFGFVRQFTVESTGKVRDQSLAVSNISQVSHLGPVSGDTDLEQFPFLVTALPEPFSIKNPIDTDVFIRISNFSFTIASGTINLFLDDIQRSNLQIEEFFGGLGGFDVTWENNQTFEYDAQVDVRWEFFDTDVPANKITIRYPFFTVPDLAPPRIINLLPADGTEGVLVTGPIQFDIVDFENGVDIESLSLYVNNILIEDGINGDLEITELNDKTGYTVKFTPLDPWLYGDFIPVAIFVKDNSENNNEAFFTYGFTTEESLPPRLLNINPSPCTVAVPVGTNISVDVIDGGHGLDKDSLLLTVEEIDRGGMIILIPIVHRDT